MKRLLILVCCAFALSAFGPVHSASAGIHLWHRHHKDKNAAAKPAKTPKTAKVENTKSKHSLFHHNKDQARSLNADMRYTGPKSVGGRHPEPGPAGAGAE